MLNLQMEQRSLNMLQMVITSSIYVNFWYISYTDFWEKKMKCEKITDDRRKMMKCISNWYVIFLLVMGALISNIAFIAVDRNTSFVPVGQNELII